MVGYGLESTHFTMELTYNYGLKSYKHGNEFGGVAIKSKEIIERVKEIKYPFEATSEGIMVLAPGGFKFFIINEDAAAEEDPIKYLIYSVTDLPKTIQYWDGILNMKKVRGDSNSALLSYNNGGFGIQFTKINEPIDRAEAFGRIAFAVPFELQPKIDELIKKNNQPILTPLVSLDTPGKADVRVIILADPDGHEICFVDDEGFSQLSEFDPESDAALDKYIKKDPFQD